VRVHWSARRRRLIAALRLRAAAHQALERLSKEPEAVLLYLRQEGRGIGLANKLRAYRLQDQGLDTVEANQALGLPADLREYGIGAQILHYLGVRRMRILTNNPKKMHGLSGYGLELVDQLPLETVPNPNNAKYLQTKRAKLGHWLREIEPGPERPERTPGGRE
jgi:3,4-dihydroxy 2-butanone 4-phosphate synthase/GTP cyclohydrolase II